MRVHQGKTTPRRLVAVCGVGVCVLLVSVIQFQSYYRQRAYRVNSTYVSFRHFHKANEWYFGTPFPIVQTTVTFRPTSFVINQHEAYKNSTQELRTLIDDEKRRKSAINCSLLFNGSLTEISTSKVLRYKNYGDAYFIKATKNCATYKQLRKYYSDRDVSDGERSYPLAYSILVHHDVDGFERLLRAVYRPHNVYCIHVDLKAPTLFFQAISNISRCFSNVFLQTKREIVVYAGYTRLQADLNCFADLLAFDWKYVLNYAGQELPLRPNNQLVDILRHYNDSNIVKRQTDQRKLNPSRWTNKYATTTNDTTRTGSIKRLAGGNVAAPFGLRMTKGSAYGVFSRAFARYVLYNDKARTFLAWCATTYSPDEHFWATLNNGVDNAQMGAPGAVRGVQPTAEFVGRYSAWSPLPCHGKVVRGVCLFGAGDLPSLVARRELVANKFELSTNVVVVDCVEALLDVRHRQGSLADEDVKYYTKLARITKGIV